MRRPSERPQLKREPLDTGHNSVRFLETNEIEEWCSEHRIRLRDTELLHDPKLLHVKRITYAHGGRSGREQEAAAASIETLRPWDQCLLWVRQWSTSGSTENWPAFYNLRAEQGELRSLEKVPGHLFLTRQRALLIAFLTHLLRNAWDADLLPVKTLGRLRKQFEYRMTNGWKSGDRHHLHLRRPLSDRRMKLSARRSAVHWMFGAAGEAIGL